MIEIPFKRLDADVLTAIIEEFILREGTDYGAYEADFATKVDQVNNQLASGDIIITYDPKTENCTLLTRQQLRRSLQAAELDSSVGREENSASYEDYCQDSGGVD